MPVLVHSIDPRTGADRGVVTTETTNAALGTVVESARVACDSFQGRGRTWRAGLLRTIADALDGDREALVEIADAETALGPARLGGEVARSVFQFRLFADVLDDGAYLEAAIDPAATTVLGPRPDLRRMLVPIGPVAVFGSSNFPFAFSVPGGDSASALAAGCPIVIKAHESHPATAQRCAAVMSTAADAYGAPAGVIGLVYGRPAAAGLVQHPAIKAVGFTGSVKGGQALLRLIDERPEPIPFYGELSSLNPVVVTPQAAAERGADIAAGLVVSFTLGGGQFCTKPGLVFVPRGAAGDAIVAAAGEAVQAANAPILLNAGIAASYRADLDRLLAEPQIRSRATSAAGTDGFTVPVRLLEVNADQLTAVMVEEHFGPVSILVRYGNSEALVAALRALPASLTATLHIGAGEVVSKGVSEALRDRAGRLVFNGFPTGVAVSWAQHHGGSWPATNSLHTSVGATAIRRFLRPFVWQDAPEAELPLELRDATRGVPRRIDGVRCPDGVQPSTGRSDQS